MSGQDATSMQDYARYPVVSLQYIWHRLRLLRLLYANKLLHLRICEKALRKRCYPQHRQALALVRREHTRTRLGSNCKASNFTMRQTLLRLPYQRCGFQSYGVVIALYCYIWFGPRPPLESSITLFHFTTYVSSRLISHFRLVTR